MIPGCILFAAMFAATLAATGGERTTLASRVWLVAELAIAAVGVVAFAVVML